MFRDAVIEDPLLRARTQGVGILTREKAIAYGALGPTARASGVDIDVRRDHPHAAYGMVDFDVVTCENGDVFDKAVVRILEMFESIRGHRDIRGAARRGIPLHTQRRQQPAGAA